MVSEPDGEVGWYLLTTS